MISDGLFGDALFKEINCSFIPTKRVLKIAGSARTDLREPKNWIADYAYLPNNFNSTVFFYPLIQTVFFDTGTYIGFDHGLFLRLQVPLATSRWDIGVDETITPTQGGAGFHDIWHSSDNLVHSFLDYSCCKITPTRDPSSDPAGTSYPLLVSKICPWPTRTSGIADIHADVGWNFVNTDRHQLSIYARAVAPTGTRPEGKTLFEAMVGNGTYWELGGGLLGHIRLWDTQEDKQLSFCWDIQLTHLFTTQQRRAFDLKKFGPLSRYMLAIDAPLGSDVINTTPVANLTYGSIRVKKNIQADVTALFNYTSNTFSWNIGYNFWTTSCEKITSYTPCAPRCISNGLTSGNWRLIGSDATIHTLGTNNDQEFITINDIDKESAQTGGLSHTFITQFDYTWIELEGTRVTPHLGIGMAYEAGGSNCAKGCTPSVPHACDCCRNIMPWQWSIWLTGGFTF
jgi:hypothetical protein